MKIVTYNIQYGLGQDNQYNLERIADAVRGADIIALQEVDRYWARSGNLDQPAELGRYLPEYYWVYGANCDMHPHGLIDHNASPRDQRRRQFGTMILSRSPILSSRNFHLPKYGTLVQHSIQQGALEAVIDTPFGTTRFYSTHLSHLLSEARLSQIEKLLQIHRTAYGEGGAWCGGHPDADSGWTEGGEPPMPQQAVLLGDFNFSPRCPEYDKLVGPKSEKYGRLNHREGFVDAWVAAGQDELSGSTHPDANTRIDHCFVSPSLVPHIKSCRVDSQNIASDHWPVWVELG